MHESRVLGLEGGKEVPALRALSKWKPDLHERPLHPAGLVFGETGGQAGEASVGWLEASHKEVT